MDLPKPNSHREDSIQGFVRLHVFDDAPGTQVERRWIDS